MKYLRLLPALLTLVACSTDPKKPEAAGPASPPLADSAAQVAGAPSADAEERLPTNVPDTAAFWKRALANPNLEPRYYFNALDFSQLWINNAEGRAVGYIGDKYERLRFVFREAELDSVDPTLYHVRGVSRVQRNVVPFSGTLEVRYFYEWKDQLYNLDTAAGAGSPKRGVVVLACELREPKGGAHMDVFRGMLTSWGLMPEGGGGKAFPDDEPRLDPLADLGRYGNAFEGEWRSYDGRLRERVRWGDKLIPDAGTLNAGNETQLVPAPQFAARGWQSYRAAQAGDAEAKALEEAEWW